MGQGKKGRREGGQPNWIRRDARGSCRKNSMGWWRVGRGEGGREGCVLLVDGEEMEGVGRQGGGRERKGRKGERMDERERDTHQPSSHRESSSSSPTQDEDQTITPRKEGKNEAISQLPSFELSCLCPTSVSSLPPAFPFSPSSSFFIQDSPPSEPPEGYR